jgi:pseudouridine-5'-phosphate glycosidase
VQKSSTLATPPARPTGHVLSAEVADALSAGRPVVALESTLLAHGLPWPENRAAAAQVKDAERPVARFPRPSPCWTVCRTSG